MSKTVILLVLMAAAVLLCSCSGLKVFEEVTTAPTDNLPLDAISEENILITADEAWRTALRSCDSWKSDSLNRVQMEFTCMLQDGEKPVYEVSLICGDDVDRFLIDAFSAEILNSTQEKLEIPPVITTAEDAAAAALDYFGLSEADVAELTVEYDETKDLSWRIYYVNFTYDSVGYECEVTPLNGCRTSNVDIALDGALELAINDFTEHSENAVMRDDLTTFMIAGECFDMITGRIGENDTVEYTVSFKVGGYEFNYLLSKTGHVLIFTSTEIEDWEGYRAGESYTEPYLIGDHEALKIALADAGVSVEEHKNPEVEYDSRDGYGVYEVSFEDGEREYRYEIGALDGEILSAE